MDEGYRDQVAVCAASVFVNGVLTSINVTFAAFFFFFVCVDSRDKASFRKRER